MFLFITILINTLTIITSILLLILLHINSFYHNPMDLCVSKNKHADFHSHPTRQINLISQFSKYHSLSTDKVPPFLGRFEPNFQGFLEPCFRRLYT